MTPWMAESLLSGHSAVAVPPVASAVLCFSWLVSHWCSHFSYISVFRLQPIGAWGAFGLVGNRRKKDYAPALAQAHGACGVAGL